VHLAGFSLGGLVAQARSVRPSSSKSADGMRAIYA